MNTLTKPLLTLFFLPLLFSNTLSAQLFNKEYKDRCEKKPKIPEESIENRFNVPNKRFEYPFTIFNRNVPNWQGVALAVVKMNKAVVTFILLSASCYCT